jgi:hypothetical protein
MYPGSGEGTSRAQAEHLAGGESQDGRCFRTGHCPSWARTRTLLIQRDRCNRPNSSNLPPFPRVRVTRCWSLLGFMLDFAVLYSHKCYTLLR